MKILITGSFGQVGSKILENLPDNGDTIRCFDLKNRRTKKLARKYSDKFDIIWGDVRNKNDVSKALEDIDIIIHLAYILPPITTKNLKLAKEVNIEGTKNILEIAKSQKKQPKILFTSSVIIYGDTRDKQQPITVDEELNPTDYYAQHKVECMKLIKESNLDYSIFVLGVIPPIHKLVYDPMMYEVPIETQIELLHEEDAGIAFVHALNTASIWNKTWHIAGGPSCRLNYLDFVQISMKAMGLGELPLEAFGGASYHSSLMSSELSNEILNYQKHTYDEILHDMASANRFLISIIKILRPLVRKVLINQSPYYKKNKKENN
ncbi:MAG TPA: NAD(P)-dependent oxidoreductase [Candidatus Bathyarchaeia archaeon]|nr:NAD(P)-dependent oxidoreductase [Candidatus Bathyarchaeia archaeon]